MGVPSVLAGTAGIGSFLLLGVSSLIGGAGLLSPLLAGLGIAAVVGGGARLLLRNRPPKPVRLGSTGAEIPAGTRTLLEKMIKDSREQRRRVNRLRRHSPGAGVTHALNHAESMLLRIDALLGSAALQSRRASDEHVMLLEGMADRYLPDLVDALENTIGSLSPAAGSAREAAAANLQRIDQQLDVLDARLDRVEHDVVAGVTRTLDVHDEFLRARFPDAHGDRIADR